MTDLILAIDQGTHSTRAMIFDTRGRVASSAQQSVTLQCHSRTEIEQSPAEILESMRAVIKSVLEDPAIDRQHIVCAGLAPQRSSVPTLWCYQAAMAAGE
jgi:glycerol kinase